MSGWNTDTTARAAATGTVTIVEGSSFVVCATNGDIVPDSHQGVYFQDTRFVSAWMLAVNGGAIDGLSATTPEPYRARFVGRAGREGQEADTPLVIERMRLVGAGLRDDIVIRNFSPQATTCSLRLKVEADFADLFEVKGGTIRHHWSSATEATHSGFRIESEWNGHRRGLDVVAPGATVSAGVLHYDITIPARGIWNATIIATPTIDNTAVETGFLSHLPVPQTSAAVRFREWGMAVPIPASDDPALIRTLERSQLDLGALRISDPAKPDRQVVAAGAPWFMALFGRDSLLTSYMALPLDPDLALGTLQTLADHQGRAVNTTTEEQPGRILHEVRIGVTAALSLGGGKVYYGSIDSTPLFVTLLGELRRWSQDDTSVRALLPAADLALDWMHRYGDRDGDGFIEYERLNPVGLLNQGWKDSWDGINFADGRLAEPPIALCEVQGYAYSAYLARAYLATVDGDDETARHWTAEAAKLKKLFNEQFWMPERGYFAIALDRDKRQVDSCASNLGHCLWSGIVDDDKAAAVVDRLMSPELFSGWGVRTLSSAMGAYNPVSYHNGSVWPHDNAITVAGLMRYGFAEEAGRVAQAIFDAAEYFDGRLPELFCGFERDEYPQPVAYPTSCSPQAWASATPIQLMRSLFRLAPDVPRGAVWMAPALPESLGDFAVDNLPLAGSRVAIRITGNQATVSGLPAGIDLVHAPRPEDHPRDALTHRRLGGA